EHHRDADPEPGRFLEQVPARGDPVPAVAGVGGAAVGDEVAGDEGALVRDLRLGRCIRIGAHVKPPRSTVALDQLRSMLSSSLAASARVWRTEATTPGASALAGSQHASRRMPLVGSMK